MALTLAKVRQISSEVARYQQPPLDVIAAAPVGEESSYAEVILTVSGCSAEPCVVIIGVNRDASEQDLRESVNARLQQHFVEHHSNN